MSDEQLFYATVTNLCEKKYSNFYGKSNKYGDTNSISTPHFSGDLFFDSELIKKERLSHNYRDGLLVGDVDFVLGERGETYDGVVHIRKKHIIHEHEEQVINLSVFCGEELFNNLREASAKFLEVRISFEVNEWKLNDSDSYVGTCKVNRIEIHNPIFDLHFYQKKRVRHVENFLLTQLCGGSYSDKQIPRICKEFSSAFSEQHVFNRRHELYESIIPLINSIRWTFDRNKSELRKKIESSDDVELRKLLWTDGDNFYEQFAKIIDSKEKNELLSEYNTIWRRVKSFDIFEEGYEWNGEQLPSIAEEYLKIPFVNSATLNAILVDGLILKDLSEKASFLQYNGLISAEAILSVKQDDYVKTTIQNKNKSISQVVFFSLASSFFEFLGLVIGGIFVWFIASLLSGNNELAHYVLFGSLFSASIIVNTLNKENTTEAMNESKEKVNYYLLRDICNLHAQAEFMNSNLLNHLMYKLEERGVRFNFYIYEILKRC